MDGDRAVEIALINKTKKVKVHCELHVDRKKILQRELDELHQELGEKVIIGLKDSDDSKSVPWTRECIDLKERVLLKKKELEGWRASPNDATDIRELTLKLSEYVIDHFSGKVEGSVSNQVLPLMANVMAEALVKFTGETNTMMCMCVDSAKNIILYCMVIGFMFYNLLKTHGIKIVTSEEPVTDLEIAEIERIAKENLQSIAELFTGGNIPLQVNTDAIEENNK